ncbi:Nif3-like dinuclear metal center hexameric protein [Raineya orbicola]|jgi:dinuclear metal center YbgI/SA1388 family protein|uniref:GTP cyclohydrolase 1 type 2 homolog n=1 Tax=Raineya orbicola TaxID=2016530 RepID=A0A2N3IHG9_9BACT|nr:Nif3-like dinuclear metal center hexameric protein [Raineya orbicola]PKQ69698.1 Dinuclear metal center protein, YbgI/SA1388 family [Raineya orbicola]
MQIREVINLLEGFAPTIYQESYDNAGLIYGNLEANITGILISLDITEAILDEAIRANCNLIVAHHPIVFKPLKTFTGKNYVERVLIKAIRQNIALYAIHTNLDNVQNGVSFHIASILGLKNIKVLAPTTQNLYKLTTFCPPDYAQKVLEALWQAGAGQIGNYQDCSFRLEGMGTYRPNEKANPFAGTQGYLEQAPETRLEVILPAHAKNDIFKALRKAHPYEEIAYYLHLLENENQEIGAGAIGMLENPMTEKDFLGYLKEKMNLKVIKHTALLGKPIQKVALCGGSGFFLLKKAIAQKADVFITADIKYHEFFDADGQILLADIGHYESEVFTKNLITKILQEKNPHIPLKISQISTNPIDYFF